MDEGALQIEHNFASVGEDHETTCWGCGLRLVLASYSPVFKCGWCGAITNRNQTSRKPDSVCFARWRCLRDRFFVCVLLLFMLFVISAGVWAVYPIVFSISYFCGVFHCIIAAILSIATISSFCMASFRSPGEPKAILWGSYPIVGKDALENYTFCIYCGKPKSPRAHHCRSCRMCIIDMDHHCPFIGNCVGAGNHRSFIAFLISVVVSCVYVNVMTVYSGYLTWPPLDAGPRHASAALNSSIAALKLLLGALANSALLLSARGLVLLYLAFASSSVEIGISVLLWQQLHFIYEGNTYINSISSQDSAQGEKGCHNLLRFFHCPYFVCKFLLGPTRAGKLQETSSSKLL